MGDVLPAVLAARDRVRAGDTLGSIALRHHTTVAAIARASKVSSRALIHPGQVLRVVATDPGSCADMAAFAEQTGHQLLEQSTQDKKFVFFLKKG